ncbi:glycoside hydrolase family 3 C-terminal domain-containing protein [Streptomyces atroolivaceus]|uniref:Glycoside hydrolase family 3 C-terminal domain-containing protein n=1 Tax=Streptomyces atroolivaceus TaxID=66869 RepID=A0ABV9VHZ6_STRAZ|nr:glycoside hydrolase family 3 C-terminal domain-containing protein [Streptomyces atroolivaceus]
MSKKKEIVMQHPLTATLTLEEKAGLVSGASFWRTRGVERLAIEPATLTDGPHGVRLQTGAGDHLGINESRPATAFPTATSLGSSWNPALVEEVGRALGAEARALGVDILLGPGVNIKRSPLCGRNFEYFSEDPFLSGALGTSWVNGVQAQGVGASLKHFAANNQETDRMRVDAVVDERTLREIYLPAFETIVDQANPATVMCSYNRVNGTSASQNRWLLTDVLRDEWGFQGYVVSDWGAVVDPDAALAAGLDLEMPSTGDRGPAAMVEAVRAGAVDEADLDQAVSRLLTVHDRVRASRGEAPEADLDAHHGLARRTACEGAVLLRNEDTLLPLSPSQGGRIAVIGEFARTARFQGAGSSQINPTRVDDALTAIRAKTTREVVFESGFSLDGADSDAHEAAVRAARDADTVVLFLGLPPQEESEGFDRTHIDLPAAQLALLDAVTEVSRRVVVVLSNGGVVSLRHIADRVPAILEMWLAGQAGGSAAADLLFGAAEPGGRLAETIPLALTDTPAHINWPGSDSRVLYGERVYVGYRWYDTTERAVAFPFGFGLSYTSFSYSDLRVTVTDPSVARVTAEVTVTNTGSRPGSDVVQIYVSAPASRTDRPHRELRAFRKVHLGPGESTTVALTLGHRAFAYWSSTGWRVDPGEYRIEAAASSRDIRDMATIVLEVPAVATPLRADSTLDEWKAHPVGGPVLQGLFDLIGGTPPELTDPHLLVMIGPMPLANLIAIAAGVDGRETVAHLLHEVDQHTPGRSHLEAGQSLPRP